jgi:predicted nucleotidyltransferase component of viral defense system
MAGKRKRQVVTSRQLLVRAAQAAQVSGQELDRAIILGQIAHFLTQHRRIGREIAFKGGAVMRLLDDSPRFSGDLDGAAVFGKTIRQEWIEEALWDNPQAKRVFVGGRPRIINKTSRGISYPIIECRAVGSGQSPVTLRLSINWSECLQLAPVWRELRVHGIKEPIRIPTVDPRERAAEKLRAFLERADVNDAFDLDQFAKRDWSTADWAEVQRLLPIKLQNSSLRAEADLPGRFDRQVAAVKATWPGEIVVATGVPNWEAIQPGVDRFRDLVG